MKNILKCILGVSLLLMSCEADSTGYETELDNAVYGKAKKSKTTKVEKIRECLALSVDHCNEPDYTNHNFWWPPTPTSWTEGLFTSAEGQNLVYSEYSDGTVNITGVTMMGNCMATIDIWLKDKKDWATWSADGGDFKEEGCSNTIKENLNYYVIDDTRSTITSAGSDCLEEGVFKVEQRPDPNDPATPNFGVFVGAGGSNWSSDVDAEGLSGWGWMVNDNGDRWIIDLNFDLECEKNCETAFARGTNGETCFIDNGFNRWGWSIGPLTEGDYSYEVYAGAGQCDIDKGALVGTVDVNYAGGEVTVTYNIDPSYTVEETHTYAGNDMFPTGNNGMATVAPGQYTVGTNLSGDVYVIAHAVVCN